MPKRESWRMEVQRTWVSVRLFSRLNRFKAIESKNIDLNESLSYTSGKTVHQPLE